jgi:hypothetical protein
MIRATTAPQTYVLPFETSELVAVRIYYSQRGKVVLEKNEEQVKLEGKEINWTLTQQETLMFDDGAMVSIQLHVKTVHGAVLASEVDTVTVGKILKDEVL